MSETEPRVPTAAPARVDRFFGRLAQAERAVLFLDYDGTLAPFTERRDAARPYPGVAERLADLPRTRLVLVTGRRSDEVLRLLGATPPPEVWGVHGLERRAPDGRLARRALPDEAERRLARAEAWAREHVPPARLERKPGALAVHFRGLGDEATAALEREVRAALGPLGRPPLRLAAFDGGLELRAEAVTKARAVDEVLDEGPDALAAYLGDDLTDEDAFAALARRQPEGLSALVRPAPRASRADVYLRPPEALLGFLDRWRATRRNVP